MHRQLLHRTCFNTRWGKASDWNPWAKEQPEGQVAKWDNILWGRELRFLSSQPKQYSAGSCRWRGRKIASHSERARTGSFTRKSKSCFHLVHHRHRAEKERCLHSVPFNDSPALAVGSCIAMLCSEDQSRTARYSQYSTGTVLCTILPPLKEIWAETESSIQKLQQGWKENFFLLSWPFTKC